MAGDIEDHKWCFAWQEEDPDAVRGAAQKSAMWKPGDEITVSFIDGDKKMMQKVWQAAHGWIGPDMANLKFVPRSKGGQIRISFKLRGSWSAVGTTCRHVAAEKPTMNFGWLKPDSTDAEINRVVLHEFGHALGLIHEHQSPSGGITWKRAQVIADLQGPPHFWTDAQIETNMFRKFEKKEVNATKLDEHSIMLYPIPKTWTTGFSSSTNAELSELDRKLIRKIYPH